MHPIIRTSLLTSIQTIRAVLLGMETMLKHFEDEKPKVRMHKEEEEDMDLQELAKVLGMEPDNAK